ncbi:MAG: HEPN domain-containing protein [Actinomycetota bacterium]|nr:HEPN domain-containing protein [Actinomycetota bacterium]
MPPDRLPPNTPEEWLNRAKSNLIQAKNKQPGIYLEDLCFNAQQAAEKSIKALLLYRNVRFPYVHDLAELINILEKHGEEVPAQVRDTVKLTDYAVEARYPGIGEPVTDDEYEEAIKLAEEVVEWVENKIK